MLGPNDKVPIIDCKVAAWKVTMSHRGGPRFRAVLRSIAKLLL